MVEHTLSLDNIFGSLADPTRRDILQRVSQRGLTISEIAAKYDVTFAAISKHLKVLEKAELIIKKRRGKEQIVYLSPQAFVQAADYLTWYRQMWEERFDSLDDYLRNNP